MSNDVALLELAEPVEWSRRVRAVCLPGGADADRRLERRLGKSRQPGLPAGRGGGPHPRPAHRVGDADAAPRRTDAADALRRRRLPLLHQRESHLRLMT